MRPTVRGKSNTKKVPPSQLLEQEAMQMEEKLKALKAQMNGEKMKREQQQTMNTSQSRWASSSTSKPLKNFAKNVIKDKNEYIQKTGGKLGGTGSFQKTQPTQQRTSLNKTQQNPLIKPQNNSRPNSAKKGNFIQRPSSNQGVKENKNQQQLTGILPTNTSSKEVLGQQQQNAQNNLQKHIQMQKKAEPEHITFLKDINLVKYQDKFEENGFDDLDAIIELNTELLNEMMIPAGHQIKIMKKVDKIRKEKNIEPEKEHILHQYKQKPEQPKPKPQQIKKRTDLVELEYQEPQVEKHSIAIGDDDQKPVQKASVFDGQFDEKESHNSFLEALYEFRGQKPPQQQQSQSTSQQDQQKPKQRKSVSFQPSVEDNEGKSSQYRKKKVSNTTTTTTQGLQTIHENGSTVNIQKNEEPKKGGLFFMGGGGTFNNDDYKPVTNIDGTNLDGDTQTVNKEIPVGDKIGCWVCYKLFLKAQQINYSGKSFCSQKCYQKFLETETVKCFSSKCNKELLKAEGQFSNGQWYCNEKCAPSLETIVLQMRQKQLDEQKEIEYIQNKKQQKQEEEKSILNEEQIAELERSFVKTKQAAQQKQNGSGEIDLNNNDIQENKSQILNMEQLELKYKLLNMQKEKSQQMKEEHQQNQQNQKEILDDSLEM